MININFSISNPFAENLSDIVFMKFGKLTENKFWTITLHKNLKTIIDFHFDISTGISHSGILLWVGLLGFFLEFELYDRRHR